MDQDDAYVIGRIIGSIDNDINLFSALKTQAKIKPISDTVTPLLGILSSELRVLGLCPDTCQEIDALIKLNQSRKKNEKEIDGNRQEVGRIFPLWDERITREIEKTKMIQINTDTTLNPEKLCKGPAAFLDLSIWTKLSGLEQLDLTDACRCIIVGACTPAAMITMRCIESALRTYYQNITGNDPSHKVWGRLINELSAHANADKKLLGYLDYLKDIRNKLEHPDARYTQSEAEDVLSHAFYILKIIYA